MKRVEGKVFVVTGGARGIGGETCRVLAREGASVTIADVLDEEGTALQAEIRGSGGQATFRHLDVTDEQNVAQVFQDTVDEFGGLNGSVNCAGISGGNFQTHETSEDEWELVVGINAKGTFLCTKHAVRLMKELGLVGSIVNISSVYGLVGSGSVAAYHASKGAVRLMAKNDALSYGRDNIRVNSIHPGLIRTDMTKNVSEIDSWIEDTPLNFAGEPSDIAFGALFLLSDEARFITGTELIIDGGITCR